MQESTTDPSLTTKIILQTYEHIGKKFFRISFEMSNKLNGVLFDIIIRLSVLLAFRSFFFYKMNYHQNIS